MTEDSHRAPWVVSTIMEFSIILKTCIVYVEDAPAGAATLMVRYPDYCYRVQ
jgi:hypothetical protein